jgi:hypothetical protein
MAQDSLDIQVIYIWTGYKTSDFEYLYEHNWQESYDIPIAGLPSNHPLRFEDIDNDGNIEVFGRDKNDTVKVYEYDVNDNPKFHLEHTFPNSNYWVDGLYDMDNDGTKEIFIHDANIPNVKVYRDDYSFIREMDVSNRIFDRKPLYFDIDNNEMLDIVNDCWNDSIYAVRFYEYNPMVDSLFVKTEFDSLMTKFVIRDTVFTDTSWYWTAIDTVDSLLPVSDSFSDFVVGDLDGDGLNEIATGGGSGILNIFETSAEGYDQVYFDKLNTSNMYSIGITNDIDNNGKIELILKGSQNGETTIFWFEADDNNSYKMVRKAYIDIGTKTMHGTDLRIHDVNMDNKDDLIFVNWERLYILTWNINLNKWEVYLYFRRSEYDGLWGNIYERSFPGTIIGADFYDLDKDGDQDMFISSTEGKTLIFWSNQSSESSINVEEVTLFSTYILFQNYPNPFNPSTVITFTIPKSEDVNVEIFNTLGQRVEVLLNKHMKAGYHEVEFNAQYFASGIYFYKIEAGEWNDVKKMILLR